jgi:hypothetical protein
MLTTAMLAEWWWVLNASCFDLCLPECTFVIGPYRGPDLKEGTYDACYYANYSGSGTIFINCDLDDLTYVQECLVHEMIHQWQDLCRLRLDHRAVFKAWCQLITKRTGLVP